MLKQCILMRQKCFLNGGFLKKNILYFFLNFWLPLLEIIVDFFDDLKRLTSGYASFDMKDDGGIILLFIFLIFMGKFYEKYFSK